MSGPFKMKGSPMARNFGAPFKADEKKMTAAEMQAASLAAAEKADAIEVSGGKKTKQGSFVQYPKVGSSVAGSSIRHGELRDKEKNRSISSGERAELAKLNSKTEQAYKRDIL